MTRNLPVNPATVVMALLLAALTWIYLYSQDTDQSELPVLFQPRIEAKDLALATFTNSAGRELLVPGIPGNEFKVLVTGPKGDVKALRPRTFKCEPIIGPEKVDAPEGFGKVTIVLDRKDFDLPAKFSVDPLPSPNITLRYVKYVTRRIKIVATADMYDGYTAPDHKVVDIAAVPGEIEAKVPADRPEPLMVPAKRIRLEGNKSSFTIPGELEDPLIKPIRAFELRVEIVPEPKLARLTLDLSLSAKPENLGRIDLKDKTIIVELRGPEELVREAEKRPAAFQPYVVVTDTDMEPPGLKSIGTLGCHILDPKFKEIGVVLMADMKPENRQVKIEVKSKP